MLDGQAQTIEALLGTFPQGADHPELALVRATLDVGQGRLDETAAHLEVAEAYARDGAPDRLPRLRVAIASLKLSLARRSGHLAGVRHEAEFLATPLTGQSDEDIALGNDLRAAALMNLGIIEAWSLGVPDGERHLTEGARPCPADRQAPTSKSAASPRSLSPPSSARSPRSARAARKP